MYVLDPTLDLRPLVGAELLQVCLGWNEVLFHFDRDVRMKCESALSISIRGGAARTIARAPEFGVYAGDVLGKKITEVAVASRTDIRLTLEDCWIQLHGGTEGYEDYEISWHGHHVIV